MGEARCACCGLGACRHCGLRGFATVDYAADAAVDYDAAHLWIRGNVGAGFAPTPLRQD